MKAKFVVLALLPAIAACDGTQVDNGSISPQELQKQIETLQSENNQLKSEIEQLKATPSALLSEVTSQLKENNIPAARLALRKIEEKFPNSQESRTAAELISKLEKEEEDKVKEAARLAELGFKGLKVSSSTSNGESTIQVKSIGFASRWTFDSYGDEWYYKEAEKGQRFITAKVTVSSKEKDPNLMGFAAYVADGNQLRQIGEFSYRFARWDDYGSYLGNEADYRNDFAHSSSIPFSAAATISSDESKKTIYVVATHEACHRRSEDRFRNPPVSYYSFSCKSLASTLTIDSFSDGKLVVLKRLN